MMTKDKKRLEFHKMMARKALLEKEFWDNEMNFHLNQALRIKNKKEKFI